MAAGKANRINVSRLPATGSVAVLRLIGIDAISPLDRCVVLLVVPAQAADTAAINASFNEPAADGAGLVQRVLGNPMNRQATFERAVHRSATRAC